MAFSRSPLGAAEPGEEVPVSKHQLKPTVAQVVQHSLDQQGKRLDQAVSQLVTQLDAQTKQLEAQTKQIEALSERAELQSKQIETLNADLNRLTTALLSRSAPGNVEPAARPTVQTSGAAAPSTPAVVKAEPAVPETGIAPDGSPIHIVKRGENLISIARQHGTSVSELLRINKIEDERKLQVGQTLMLPKTATLPPQSTPSPQ